LGATTETIQVGFENPQGINPFGHSFIKIGEEVYDISGPSKTNLKGRSRTAEELFSDDRKESLEQISVTYEQKKNLRESLARDVGQPFNDYNYLTNNCADYVEGKLREIGISLPKDFGIVGIEVPEATLRQAAEYEKRRLQ